MLFNEILSADADILCLQVRIAAQAAPNQLPHVLIFFDISGG